LVPWFPGSLKNIRKEHKEKIKGRILRKPWVSLT
jgi:hypothetical protein